MFNEEDYCEDCLLFIDSCGCPDDGLDNDRYEDAPFWRNPEGDYYDKLENEIQKARMSGMSWERIKLRGAAMSGGIHNLSYYLIAKNKRKPELIQDKKEIDAMKDIENVSHSSIDSIPT